MLNRRSFLKAVGISPVVLVSVKAVGEVPKEVPKNCKKNLDLLCLTSGNVRFRLRPLIRRARVYPKIAHRFMLHLNDQDSEELFLEFKEAGLKNAEFTEGLTLHYVEIKWYCDTDVSFIMTKAPPLRVETSFGKVTREEYRQHYWKIWSKSK